MEIPYDKLSPEVLHGVIEEFVTREGTDYGHKSYSLADKIEKVKVQLENGTAQIVFDPETESCSIVPISTIK